MQNKSPMHVFAAVRFPAPMAADMDIVAEKIGFTRSALVRVAVREYLARQS